MQGAARDAAHAFSKATNIAEHRFLSSGRARIYQDCQALRVDKVAQYLQASKGL